MNLYLRVLTHEDEQYKIVRIGIDRTDLDNAQEAIALLARIKNVISEAKRDGAK